MLIFYFLLVFYILLTISFYKKHFDVINIKHNNFYKHTITTNVYYHCLNNNYI